MTTKADTSGLINVATIAEIAKDVNSPSAVSNWRTRRDDFPAPRSGTGRRVLFDLDEIETWLRENGKLEGRVPPRIRLRAILDGLRGELPIEDALDFLRAALVYLVASRRAESQARGQAFAVPVELDADQRWPVVREEDRPLTALSRVARRIQADNHVLAGLMEPLEEAHADGVADAQQLGLVETLDSALDSGDRSWEERAVELFDELMAMETSGSPRFSAETTTSASVTALIAALAPPRAESAFDPAVGIGGLLSAVAEKVDPAQLYAADRNHDAALFTRSRFFIEDRPLEFFEGSSLNRGGRDWPKADLIVADPPFGLAKWGTSQDYSSPRWKFGDVSPRSADFAWIQIGSLSALSGGTALILAPAHSLSEGGEARRTRKQMLDYGVVEAVIQLPSGTHATSSIQPALWMLRSTDSPERDHPILLVDASSLGISRGMRTEIPEDARERISSLLEIWRAGSGIPEADQEIAVEVWLDQIDEGDLFPPRYLASPEIDPEELEQSRSTLESELRALLEVDLPPDAFDLPASNEATPCCLIGDLVELRGSVDDPKDDVLLEEAGPGRVRYFDRKSMATGQPLFIDVQSFSPDAEPLRAGDLLVSNGPRGIGIELIDEDTAGSFFGRGVLLLRTRNQNELTPEWLRLFLRSSNFERQAMAAGDWFRGRVFSGPRIRKGNFEGYEIPIPSLEEQLRASQASRRVTDLIDRARHISTLATDLEVVMSDLAMYGGEGSVNGY